MERLTDCISEIRRKVMKQATKITFLNGGSLNPPPPVTSKDETVRYFHVFEDEPLDEAQFVDWISQAAALPGQTLF